MYARCLHNTMPPFQCLRAPIQTRHRSSERSHHHLNVPFNYYIDYIGGVQPAAQSIYYYYSFNVFCTTYQPTRPSSQATRPEALSCEYCELTLSVFLSLFLTPELEQICPSCSSRRRRRRLLGRLLSFDSSHHCLALKSEREPHCRVKGGESETQRSHIQ